MGYAIHQLPSKFLLPARSMAEALDAIKSLAGRETCGGGGQMHFMWLPESSSFTSKASLADALAVWRWQPDLSEDGSILSLDFTGENIGDEDMLFSALAPFVQSGCYLAMVGEDGCIWRWLFERGSVRRQPGTVTFDSPKPETA